MNEPKFIIAIGASAGGLNALAELVSQLHKGMHAAFCIVLHLSNKSIGNFLVNKLQQYTTLPCMLAVHEAPLLEDHIYIAPPDQHFLVRKHSIVIGHGTKENRWKPSIDVLLRSAAAAYTSRTIGIILTGLLDDGVIGMSAIKRSGGISIVQDPNEAEYPDMPLAVLNAMEVNYCIPLSEIGSTLFFVMQTEQPETAPLPEIVAESAIAEKAAVGLDYVAPLGEHSVYTCPDCGGGLWQIRDEHISRYRCHVGHTYTERELLIRQAETLETTLWVALRMMEEQRNLLLKLEKQNRQKGFTRLAADNHERADDILVHIDRLKQVLFATQDNGTAGSTSFS